CVAGEKHQVEGQLQQFTRTLDAMRESMCRMTEGLSVLQGDAASPQDSSVIPGRSGDIEE
ncbi:MAG: hypothetical protein WBO37_09350, partial [Gammaproteobacteria bacterium]